MVIRCTQKLLKDMAVKPDPEQMAECKTFLDEWYANLLRIDRRKCLLFTNAKTLFSFLVPGVKKKDYEDFHKLFTEHFYLNMIFSGYPENQVLDLISGFGEIKILKTISRSILGSMNDYAFQYDIHIYHNGGINNANILAIANQVNDAPMSALKYQNALKEMHKEIAKITT